MHTSRILSGLYVVGALLAASVSAHPDYDGVKLPVLRRATTTTSSGDYSPTKPAGDPLIGQEDGNAREESSSSEKSQDKETTTKKGSSTDKDSKTTSDEEESTKTTDKNSKTTSTKTRIAVTDPAGGISMIEPKATEPLIYKFGETITFKWNMTSVKASPTAINVEAYNTANKHYYTIAANLSAQATSAEWDTEKDREGEFPLMEERYTLIIYDAKDGRTATPKAGYLAPWSQLSFGLYKPRGAVSNKDFQCIGCSSASGVRVVLGSTFIAVISAALFVMRAF